jgi:uncharacterized membrane protein
MHSFIHRDQLLLKSKLSNRARMKFQARNHVPQKRINWLQIFYLFLVCFFFFVVAAAHLHPSPTGKIPYSE